MYAYFVWQFATNSVTHSIFIYWHSRDRVNSRRTVRGILTINRHRYHRRLVNLAQWFTRRLHHVLYITQFLRRFSVRSGSDVHARRQRVLHHLHSAHLYFLTHRARGVLLHTLLQLALLLGTHGGAFGNRTGLHGWLLAAQEAKDWVREDREGLCYATGY